MNKTVENLQPVPEKLNPWLSIWVRPKVTARYAIEKIPMNYLVVLVLIGGIFEVLDKAVAKNIGDKISTPFIFLIALVAGPIFGYLGWWIGSGIAYIIGKWLGGKGTYRELRAVYGIINIFYIIGGIVWIPDLIIIGSSIFSSYIEGGIGATIWLFISAFLNMVFVVWGFVGTLFCVAEAHRYPVWKALITILIPTVILLLFVAIFAFIVILIL
ncbi:YIP1 family protein [Sporosarcina sp. NCCP-2222]|uniref:Yip1 family protein n=1 Tax=Sporosarcina sp. NCCP-2222 TaxID=2935073 RepID=UPI00208462C1|nr:Yip1 family protein [Sporosarcina sp. NCCP-2222]GKV57960.1 YIP1 family protein [Sporosarcina sp. NCCP-2222]